MDSNGLYQGTCEHFRGAGKEASFGSLQALWWICLSVITPIWIDLTEEVVVNGSINWQALLTVSLWPIPGPDTSATHRSDTENAVLKYLEEGLTVGLNSVVLTQIKQSVNCSS